MFSLISGMMNAKKVNKDHVFGTNRIIQENTNNIQSKIMVKEYITETVIRKRNVNTKQSKQVYAF